MCVLPSLPCVRGSIRTLSLSKCTWFKVGGPAVVFTPADESDLVYFLRTIPQDTPVYTLGLGSNVLIRDGGLDGVVIRLSTFSHITVNDDTITAGCGTTDRKLATTALQNNIAGFAFLSGIPGTIGGAIAMNAGAYNREIKDILLHVTGVTHRGEKVRYTADQLTLSYRHCGVKNVIFTSATFKKSPGNFERIKEEMDAIENARGQTQPIRQRTGGSTFKNPRGDGALLPYKAWQLIDKAGFRGRQLGGAKVSEQHCNFLINTGQATATEIETLGETIRTEVRKMFDIELQWEIQRMGKNGE